MDFTSARFPPLRAADSNRTTDPAGGDDAGILLVGYLFNLIM